MTLFSIGRICVKLAGRDAGRKCVVVDTIDDRFVVVDGNVRRKRVNTRHLEPLAETIEIKSKASHSDVKTAFEKLGEVVWEKKSKTPAARPRQVKKKHAAEEEKSMKKPVTKKVSSKKTTKPVEATPDIIESVEKTSVETKE
ncbi:50S ribosomal protein L14e [Candidatus Woesearchaeota archaeon CG10_big_fil_rev_8_21_14_0_10_36_11]|nr:MAG: 50S ribosomal protein L14e [Candidatus Woesearchaeota archaeon CG10_big_fil_rev_8_21_14_0_10_36_11]